MEEEISLRELIEILLNGKKIIALVTAACLVIGIVLTFVFQSKPLYESEASLRIENLVDSYRPSSEGYFAQLLATVIETERYSGKMLAQYLQYPTVLKRVAKRLSQAGYNIDEEDYKKRINIQVDESDTYLTVSYTDPDPNLAIDFIQVLLDEFRSFMNKQRQERVLLLADNLERLIRVYRG